MTIVFSVLLFLLGLVILIWGGNQFVDDSVSLAKKFHIPEVIIGATIVSIGTTLPETLFSATAAFQKMPDSAIGNALGSIICNTGFIAGISLVFQTLKPDKKSLKSILLTFSWLCCSFFIYLFIGYQYGILSHLSGILLLIMCVVFLLISFFRENKTHSVEECPVISVKNPVPLLLIKIILDAGLLFIGAKLLVETGPSLARTIGVPEIVISLTFIALGTSLPELITAISAIRKKSLSLSIGNILGADLLNLLLVGGLSCTICPIHMTETLLTVELPLCILLVCILCIPTLLCKKTQRLQGLILIGIYFIYIGRLFIQ